MHDHINYIFLLKPTNWHAVIVDSTPVQFTPTNNGFR